MKIGRGVSELWGVENRPLPLTWPMAYTTACTTVQAVMYSSPRAGSRSLRALSLKSDCGPRDVLCCFGTGQRLYNFSTASHRHWNSEILRKFYRNFSLETFRGQKWWKIIVVPGDPGPIGGAGPNASASPASWMIWPCSSP